MKPEAVEPIAAGRCLADAPLCFHDIGTAAIAYRKVGEGPPLLLVHGWPLSGLTYRKLVPLLLARRTCYVVDLPGAGETLWQKDNDFGFHGQARSLARLLDGLGLPRCDVLAHDTGATIARELALIAGERIGKLILIDTEIPGHRPPWIRLFQATAVLPGANATFRLLLRSRAFVRSSMGFGGCFLDRQLLDGDFASCFIQPLIESRQRLDGQLRYLRGIDWTLVDGLATRHREIRSPVLLVWGAEDPIFPKERAEPMISQFADCRGMKMIPGARLLPHEEQPEAVSAHVLDFLASS